MLKVRKPILVAVLPVLFTGIAYIPTMKAGFIWDDPAHVTKNQNLRDWKGLWRIWFDFRANPQQYPLTYTSFWKAMILTKK